MIQTASYHSDPITINSNNERVSNRKETRETCCEYLILILISIHLQKKILFFGLFTFDYVWQFFIIVSLIVMDGKNMAFLNLL